MCAARIVSYMAPNDAFHWWRHEGGNSRHELSKDHFAQTIEITMWQLCAQNQILFIFWFPFGSFLILSKGAKNNGSQQTDMVKLVI